MQTVAQRSFAGGEIAPALYGHIDQAKYASGARTLRNMIVQLQGGAKNRPGTTLDAEVKDSTKTVRLIPFIYSPTQAVMLEFGDQYIRFHKSGAQVLEAWKAITGAGDITSANPCAVNPLVAHGYSNGDEVTFKGVQASTPTNPLGMAALLNGQNFKVANVLPNSFTLKTMPPGSVDVDTTTAGAYLGGGSVARVYTIASPYAAADLPNIRFAQSADVLILTHPSYAPYQLARISDISWTLSQIGFLSNWTPIPGGITAVKAVRGAAGSGIFQYVVTAVSSDGKESPPGQDTTRAMSAATQANPCVVTSNAHGYQNGDSVYITGVVGMTQLNGRTFQVDGVTANTFKLFGVDSTGYGAYVNGGTVYRPYTNVGAAADPTPALPIQLTWTVTGTPAAAFYNIYRLVGSFYGLIGIIPGGDSSITSYSFVDIGGVADTSKTPPIANPPFLKIDPTDNFVPIGAGDYPTACVFYQQRLMLANSNNHPDSFWASLVGDFYNFAIHSPLTDADSLSERLVASQVQAIQHFLSLGQLIVFTSSGEWSLAGDSSGTLKPTAINSRQYSYNGSNFLRPLGMDASALYVQNRGTIVRDLSFDFLIGGYRGNDLTLFSRHLFEGYTLVDWAFAKVPNQIVWIARSDGTLLGLTYMREQQMLAWHRHDFVNGAIENVCTIPEGDEDATYVVVRRTLPQGGGVTKRYIERLSTRFLQPNIADNVFVDAAVKYDGRNTDPTLTMTLSGGSGSWDYTQTLTLTASAAFFKSYMVGDQIQLVSSDGKVCRANITAFTSSTVVSVKPDSGNVPTLLHGIATATWARAVSNLLGIWHLDGQRVAITGDGYVVASPNNPQYPVQIVTNGALTLTRPYAVIQVGYPITADLETLDIDFYQSETIANRNKGITNLSAFVEASRGIWVSPRAPAAGDNGVTTQPFVELKIRGEANENYATPVALATEVIDIDLLSEWNSNGRVCIRQTDPMPLGVLAVYPSGWIPTPR